MVDFTSAKYVDTGPISPATAKVTLSLNTLYLMGSIVVFVDCFVQIESLLRIIMIDIIR